MATVKADLLGDLTGEMHEGAWTRLTRRYQVTGLTDTDFTIIMSAAGASGIPAAGTSPTGYSNLVLSDHKITLLPDKTTAAYVDCIYVARAEEETKFTFYIGASLTQVETEKDIHGNLIQVSYTYPADYPYATYLQSQTVTTGAKVTVMQPELTLVAVGTLQRDFPHYEAAQWIYRTNSTAWGGASAGRWLCADVQSELHDYSTSPTTYKFRFTFQYNPHGWNPSVRFIDPNTGQPPPDLVANVGYGTIVWYQRRNFHTQFSLA